MTEMMGRKLFFGHTYASVQTPWIRYQISRKDGFLNYPPPFLPSPPSPYVANSSTSHKDSAKISPAVLFIIVILAVLFFISGILHLLVRFLTKKPSSTRSNLNLEASSSDVLQRQLQQLFNLHDSGLDQAFIDSLPLFSYKEIVGPKKEPFDCAVCLCEFSETDQLRLLPTCSHAFHIDCIDTWLLSNSTCPLCRGALFNPGFPIENPIYDYDDFREEDGFGENGVSSVQKRVRIEEVATEKGVFPVRLGKFRKLSNAEGEEVSGETSSSTLDARRCYSMGSYQYVVGDAKLRVALSRDRALCDGKLVEGKEPACNGSADDSPEGKKISIGTKTDSYSVSKIWLWSKKGKFASSSGAPLGNPTSPNLDLSWMHKENGI